MSVRLIWQNFTYKGGKEGYKIAAEFFANTWLQHGGERKRFLACPGNHDPVIISLTPSTRSYVVYDETVI
jgi:hypothetical protein